MRLILVLVVFYILALTTPVYGRRKSARYSLNSSDVNNHWKYFKGNHSRKFQNQSHEAKKYINRIKIYA